jgi:hypothetical protein
VPLVPHVCPSILRDAIEQVTLEQINDLPEPGANQSYSKRVLVDTPELLVTAARWRGGAQSELHGHSESAGLYRVVTGQVEEERYIPFGTCSRERLYSVSILAIGDDSFLPEGSFHQLRAVNDSVTLHAYAPRPSDSVAQLTQSEFRLLKRARQSSATNRSELAH